MAAQGRPSRVLYVVACGGRPAGDLAPFVEEAQAAGWEVCVIATPSALKFMDLDDLARLTGHVVRYDYKQPEEPDVLPPADAMIVARPPSTPSTSGRPASATPSPSACSMKRWACAFPWSRCHFPTSPLPSIPRSVAA
jgi:hypothetical protein